MKALAAALHVGAGLALAVTLEAQGVPQAEGLTISGVVLGANGSPLPFSTASLAGTAIERFSNERGEFILGNVSPGLITFASGSLFSFLFLLVPVPFRLATVTVRGRKSRCVVPGTDSLDADDAFGLVLAELQKNAERERLLTTTYPFEFRLLKFPEPARHAWGRHRRRSKRSSTAATSGRAMHGDRWSGPPQP